MTTADTLYVALGRLAAALGCLLGLATSLWVVASATSLAPPARLGLGDAAVSIGLDGLDGGTRALWAAGGVVASLLMLALFWRVLRAGADRGVVLSRGRQRGMLGGGTLEVSEASMHALANYTCERIDGVYEAYSKLTMRRRGWYADIALVLSPGAQVRDVALEVKKALEDSLRGHTSVGVARIRIWAQLDPLEKRRRVY